MILDSRTLQSTAQSGARAGYDGARRRKGSKAHAAVDTLGHLLTLHVTAADEQDSTQAEKLAEAVQEITGNNVELAYVDQGYTGESAAQAAEKHGVQLDVVKHTEAKRGFVLFICHSHAHQFGQIAPAKFITGSRQVRICHRVDAGNFVDAGQLSDSNWLQ